MHEGTLQQIAALSRLAGLALRHSSDTDDMLAVIDTVELIEQLATRLQEVEGGHHGD